MDWCGEGAASYSKRKELFENQKEHLELEIEKMNKVLDMLKFKCWYYETALKDGSEDNLKELPSDNMPDEIRLAFENAHK